MASSMGDVALGGFADDVGLEQQFVGPVCGRCRRNRWLEFAARWLFRMGEPSITEAGVSFSLGVNGAHTVTSSSVSMYSSSNLGAWSCLRAFAQPGRWAAFKGD